MRELLIRYLLGELEPHEHDAVQQQLAENAELRRELAHLRSCFADARQDDDPDEPPRGLAERTTTWVAESDSYDALPSRTAGLSEASDAPNGVLGWSLADLTVAGGVMLAVSMLLFPALRSSLDGTRQTMCQKNLEGMGRVFLIHADNHGGWLPLVLPHENVGMFTSRLVEGGAVSKEELKQGLVCPSSPQARLIRANPGQYSVKVLTPAELDTLSDKELAVAKAWMSPSYAYPLGYFVGRQYHFIHIRGFRMPIFSDAPGTEAGGMSPNHCSVIQVLYPDGSVAVLTSAKVNGGDDDIYSNHEGEISAGRGPNDVVLGSSASTPGDFFSDAGRPNSNPLHWRLSRP